MPLHLIHEDRGEDHFTVRRTGRIGQYARLIGRFQGQKEEQGLFTSLIGCGQQDFAEQATIEEADEFFRQHHAGRWIQGTTGAVIEHWVLGIVPWELRIRQTGDEDVVEIKPQGVLDAEDAHCALSLVWLIECDLAQEIDRQQPEFCEINRHIAQEAQGLGTCPERVEERSEGLAIALDDMQWNLGVHAHGSKEAHLRQ
jgi:hypothetical protein